MSFLKNAELVGELKYEGKVVKVYKTKTDIFNKQTGNREVIKAHVAKLSKAMKDNLLFTLIYVNEKGEILDGQHRAESLFHNEQPVYFTVVNGYGLDETKTYNVNTKNWGQDAFMHSYCDLGIADYCTYAEFQKEFLFGHGVTQQMLSLKFGDGSQGLNTIFKDGDFKIVDIELSRKWARMLHDFSGYEKYGNRSFISAMVHFFRHKDYNHQRMVYAISSRVQQLRDVGDGYLQLKATLEKLYNLNYSKKKHLYVVTPQDVRESL